MFPFAKQPPKNIQLFLLFYLQVEKRLKPLRPHDAMAVAPQPEAGEWGAGRGPANMLHCKCLPMVYLIPCTLSDTFLSHQSELSQTV